MIEQTGKPIASSQKGQAGTRSEPGNNGSTGLTGTAGSSEAPLLDAGSTLMLPGAVSGPSMVTLPPLDPTPGCRDPVPAAPRQFDLYLMVDGNITLPVANAWDKVSKGIAEYADDQCAAGVGVAVRYFAPGLMTDCTMDYAVPTTPMGVLPDNADAIKRDIPASGLKTSPTMPALQGALRYSTARQSMYRDSKQAVVLVSDGFYDWLCDAPTLVPMLLQSIFAPGTNTTSVPVYVIALGAPSLANVPGLGALLDPLSRLDPLESIAQAGHTGKARDVDLQADPSAFLKTMEAIQQDARPCDYSVPDTVQKDPSAMTLAITDGKGGQTALAKVANGAACGSGYYFADSSMAWAMLCPATCSEVKTRCASLAWVTGCTPK